MGTAGTGAWHRLCCRQALPPSHMPLLGAGLPAHGTHESTGVSDQAKAWAESMQGQHGLQMPLVEGRQKPATLR